jgi:hypothetical protein
MLLPAKAARGSPRGKNKCNHEKGGVARKDTQKKKRDDMIASRVKEI